MIHDLTDLEPLHRYDHKKILVGPLLSLWTNSSFRIFNIAGKGSKIHETIGLGFFDLEIDAKRRRADIVAALEGCFGEVEIYDSQLEMAQMAHTLWANDETARFLATVSRESRLRPIRENSHYQNLAEAVAAPEVIDLFPPHAPKSAAEQVEPMEACDLARISEPLYLHNLSDADTFANPGTLAESGSNLVTVANLPTAVPGSSVSKAARLWALSAAYWALCFVVGYLIGATIFTSFSSMRQTANEAIFSADAAASITAVKDSPEPMGTLINAVSASSIGTDNHEAQSREAARLSSQSFLTSQHVVADGETSPALFPGAQPSQKLSNQAEAAPDEQLTQSPKVQRNQPDDSISLPQSSPAQTVTTQPSATETIPALTPQAPEVVPSQVFASSASTQTVADHNEPPLLPTDGATPKAPEALASAPLRQASNSAIIPLPRRRPAVGAVSSDRPRRRIGPWGEGAQNPLLSLFGH